MPRRNLLRLLQKFTKLSMIRIVFLVLVIFVLLSLYLFTFSNHSSSPPTLSSSSSNSSLNHEHFPLIFGVNYQLKGNSGQWKLAKPWFMREGTIRPSSNSSLSLWPEEVSNITDPNTDRIVNQLMYVPEDYNISSSSTLPLKNILIIPGRNSWGLPVGQTKFRQDNCPVQSCSITDELSLLNTADAVLVNGHSVDYRLSRSNWDQIWILYMLESPLNTRTFFANNENVQLFNWTATYRADSDIVAPYEKFVSYRSIWNNLTADVDLFESSALNSSLIQNRNYAANKTKKVAWFVSNCVTSNDRLDYARQLSEYIQVDIYGRCGTMTCTGGDDCFNMLNRDYKFYLAFENSNCRDYITEKFFVNSLGANLDTLNIVPIVMGGASAVDYHRSAPPNSYIQVNDFNSPAQLAQYLHELDCDDRAYNRYFEWKSPVRVGEFINTFFWCRLCAMLHAPKWRQKPSGGYVNVQEWWAGNGVCV